MLVNPNRFLTAPLKGHEQLDLAYMHTQLPTRKRKLNFLNLRSKGSDVANHRSAGGTLQLEPPMVRISMTKSSSSLFRDVKGGGEPAEGGTPGNVSPRGETRRKAPDS